MTIQPSDEAFIDYVKFVFRTDHDLLQKHFAPTWENVITIARHRAGYAGGEKFSALPGTDTSGRTRYVFEAWGLLAHHVYTLVPTAWLNAIYRLDVRQEIFGCTEDHIAAMQTSISLGNKGRVNTMMLNSRPRQKSASRDIGGRGIMFGSRKSDQHMVLYKRGKEIAALEYRCQGKQVNTFARNVFKAWQGDEIGDPQSELVERVIAARTGYLNKALGVSTMEGLAQVLDFHLERATQLRQALQFQEEPAEREYWEGLSSEEQEDLQKATWWPDFTKV